MLMLALIGWAAIVTTNTLLHPLSQYVNRRPRGGLPQEPDDIEFPIDYLLQVVTSDKKSSACKHSPSGCPPPRVHLTIDRCSARQEFTDEGARRRLFVRVGSDNRSANRRSTAQPGPESDIEWMVAGRNR